MSGGKRPLGDNSGFINRRGHNADITTNDLSDLTIDSQPALDHDEVAPILPKTKKNKPARTHKRASRWTRRTALVVLVVAILLIAIPIILGEVLRAQYESSSASARKSLQAIISTQVLPLQKKSDITARQVSSVTDMLEDIRDGMCAGGLVDNLATLYPRAKEAHMACIAQRGRIASLVTQERDMVAMLSYIESLNASLAKITSPSTDAYAVIANEQSNWQAFGQDLQKLNPPSSLKLPHQQLVAAVGSISDGWSRLNVASTAQNAVDFQAAEKQLSDGYAAVRASKDSFAKVISDKQALITAQAAKLN